MTTFAQAEIVTTVTLGVTFAGHQNQGEIKTFLSRRWKNQVHLTLSSRFACGTKFLKGGHDAHDVRDGK